MSSYSNQNSGYGPSGQGYFDGSAGYYAPETSQMYAGQGQVYPQDVGGGMYEDMNADSQYYPQYGQSGWNQQADQGYQNWATPETTTRGSYGYRSEFTPQVFGFPVTSLTFDASYDAMYVASATQSMTTTRWKAHRASVLAVHNISDGMCYSCVAGHPEAPSSTRSRVYECMYGINKTVPMVPGRQHIPPHAYRPPYGGSSVETMAASGGKQGHIGITDMLSLNEHAATISPSAVRIHSYGGLQVHDHDISGMLAGTIHPHSGQATHISVGGTNCGDKYSHHDIFCMDIWQGLRVVNSAAFKNKMHSMQPSITAMATSQERGAIIAGCADGKLRIMDGSLREIATVKSHVGGVSSMSVSPDGMLIATTGYSSRVAANKETSILYGFPDTRVYVYDMRYLGRGGTPHMFAGVGSCPRHVSFIPDVESMASNRMLVASGQAGGGLQILVPFQEPDDKSTSFFAAQLAQGESISAMEASEDQLALGTSDGRVLMYKLAGYKAKTKLRATSAAFVPAPPRPKAKKALDMTKLYEQPVTALPIDPTILCRNADPGRRNGNDEQTKSVFSTYVLQSIPKVSPTGFSLENSVASFGSIAGKPILYPAKRTVSESFLKEAASGEGDFLLTIPTSKLDLDIMENHASQPKRRNPKKVPQPPKLNPNKLLHCPKLSSLCYEDGLNGRRRRKGSTGDGKNEIPARYRRQVRPNFKTAGVFDPADYNDTGLFPAWDYPSTMPNAFASPVLLLLYFVPEIRSAVLNAQVPEKSWSSTAFENALSPELGFLFHQIESLYSCALSHPSKPNSNQLRPKLRTWVPSNFLTAMAGMPEAEQLQVLDGSPAAVDPPRRPEAFYRFIAYQLDKELSRNSEKKLMDSLHGLDFMSVNQFVSESTLSSQSTTRVLTVDFAYGCFTRDAEKKTDIHFTTVLKHSLSRETRLRAWNKKSKAYETIVQRKIATSLPEILTLSGACAGRKEEDGLWIWRTDDGGNPWVPEIVEIELLEDGNVTVSEMRMKEDGEIEKVRSTDKSSALPEAVSKLVSEVSSKQKLRYRLDAVLSFVSDEGAGDFEDSEHPGHHILHARINQDHKKRALLCQKLEIAKVMDSMDRSKLVLSSCITPDTLQKRSEAIETKLSCLSENENDWILFNGFSATKTIGDDARAFHVPFKEPCLVVFRAMADSDDKEDNEMQEKAVSISPDVMNARSLSSATSVKKQEAFDPATVSPGMLIAFDAEFVSVQEEEAALTDSGSKVILRETRHAIARISVIDCKSRGTILDDHVLPRERVEDYLTRFSGIVAEDLDPTKSPHNLISTRCAYLKLRYLMEQGCIFLGHGLRKDFANVNLVVPPNQVIDTVEIFHQPGRRYISLRFLVNYVLKRDMQQDVHDSVEDALAAFELYEIALEWKKDNVFDKKLQEIYTYGSQTDWKLGIKTKDKGF
ncbi:unnamed protein product [Cylindrotheca closterium]|uniref:Exonuclease domain-containing protein n=1 Tax=Cylindrotheca closterium TaxID=2856 RepID=A0AAD2CHD7_9STRA|nr:unnamed protein product [Cylindrotheca closterium]